MTEDRNIKHSDREQTHFYSTFDGEIVQVDDSSFPDTPMPVSGPRISHPPVPVVPGSHSLSDAIVKAGQRRKAELEREREEEAEEEDLPLVPMPQAVEKAAERKGDPMILAVTPGSFHRRKGSVPPSAESAGGFTTRKKTGKRTFQTMAPLKTEGVTRALKEVLPNPELKEDMKKPGEMETLLEKSLLAVFEEGAIRLKKFS